MSGDPIGIEVDGVVLSSFLLTIMGQLLDDIQTRQRDSLLWSIADAKPLDAALILKAALREHERQMDLACIALQRGQAELH